MSGAIFFVFVHAGRTPRSKDSALLEAVDGELEKLEALVERANPEQSPERKCSYFPSSIEREWTKRKHAGKICATARQPDQLAAAKLWVQYATQAQAAAGTPLPEPDLETKAVLSRFECEQPDGSRATEWIEPLTGVARHPFAAVGCDLEADGQPETDLFDLSYFVLADACGAKASAPPARTFFDLGCSTWTGTPVEEAAIAAGRGSGYGPSMPLFAKFYADRCMPPTGIFGWEARPMDPTEWWAGVSAADKERVHFENSPITQAIFEKQLRAQRPEDFVAVKVDIDHVPVEHPLVEAIANEPALTARVDELFFEYHFWFDDLDFGWASHRGGQNYVPDTVDDALSLMSKLRHKGIRAHFWV